jgi:hypothetical protein
MASPKYEAFALFNQTTGAPLTGQASLMSFLTYKDTSGTNLSQPTIVEIGGGWYGFIPTLPVDTSKGIVYILDTGTNGNPTQVSRYIRQEDYYTDVLQDLAQFEMGNWEVVTTGPNTNHFVVYAQDGTTVLKKFLLKDKNGNPTASDPFKRVAD